MIVKYNKNNYKVSYKVKTKTLNLIKILTKNYTAMIKKAFVVHSNFTNGSLSLSLLLVLLGNTSLL